MDCSKQINDSELLAYLNSDDSDDIDKDYIPSDNESNISDTTNEGDNEGQLNAIEIEDPEQAAEKNVTPCKPRKRQRNESKRATAKKLRNSGKNYINIKGNLVESRKFQNIDCGCAKKCIESCTENERRELCERFKEMGDFSRQNAYLFGLVHQAPIKQRRPRDGSKQGKLCSNLYHVQKEDSTIRVCKKYFLDTFLVSDGRLTRAIQKVRSGKSPGEDLRGKHVAAQKITPDQKQLVKDHINLFPAFQSHYTRKDNPHRKYLSPELNITKMYISYQEWCEKQQINPVKEYFYRHVFNTEFNLHFHVTRKDTCKQCDKYKQLVDVEDNQETKAQLEQQHLIHLRKAERARDSLKCDGEKAKANPNLCTITIDLQKALPFPILSVSEAYYRRNMYCYNLGIHDVANNQGYMYVWDETIASRGSQEVSSCLIKHIYCNQRKHIIIYSDTCTGQNRNLKVALSLLKVTQVTTVEVIDHKFMISGHSYLPNDSDFGLIEKASRHKTIYVPDDWYKIIQTSRRHNKYMLRQMQETDFVTTEELEKATTKRKKDTHQNNVNWLKIQYKEKPLSIFYKYTLDEDIPFSELNVKSNKEGRPYTPPRSIS